MLYYKQQYRGQPIFYLLSILSALLGASVFMGCDVAELNSQPIERPQAMHTEFPYLEATEEVTNSIRIAISMLLDESEEWECKTCTFRNPLSIKICEMCDASRKINKDKEWLCKACGFANPLSAKICKLCSPESFEQVDTNLVKTSFNEKAFKEECPICLEENELQKQGKHDCKQCKKSICKPCYQGILKTTNKSCPLCRYEKY